VTLPNLPTEPLPCPRCGKLWEEGFVRLIPVYREDDVRVIVDCSGCGTSLWLFIGAMDENGIGLTHFVDLGRVAF
jgi:hypothetical protein